MRRKTNKRCKKCNHLLEHIIIYDSSYYKCMHCGKSYEIEEYWKDEK